MNLLAASEGYAPGAEPSAPIFLQPDMVELLDDFRALTVGLGNREYDRAGNPYRKLTMREGFEARMRMPRNRGGGFQVEFDVADPSVALSLTAEVDYEPCEISIWAQNHRYLARGEFPPASRDVLVVFFRLQTAVAASQPVPSLSVHSLSFFFAGE